MLFESYDYSDSDWFVNRLAAVAAAAYFMILHTDGSKKHPESTGSGE